MENQVYIKGELSKARPDARVTVLNTELSKKEEKEEPRLVQGISEFVYLPEFSGIAFRSIPNQIEPKAFIRIFSKIIENTLGNFFIQCEIKMLDDLRSFYDRLSLMDSIEVIKARVKPPNPLFGKLWESLKKYLNDRKLDELQLKEIAKKKNSVRYKCQVRDINKKSVSNPCFNLTLFLFYGTIKRRGACFRANFAAAMSVGKGTNAG